MSQLSVDQKTVMKLLSDQEADFIIPDYQRPYAWEKSECDTLWNDLFTFAFPDNDYSKFNSARDKYFLGPIVSYPNPSKQQEIIDGQQRLTTLMLLLRAFYNRFDNMQDENSMETKRSIERCIWKTNEFGKPDVNSLKLETEVATDEAKQEFRDILKTGNVLDEQKSRYADNYRFFQGKINEFLSDYASFLAYFPMRILNNCILLPIEADSSETAMRIFSTLNDRGKPLSDADIFKAQLYKHYKQFNLKDDFVKRWKALEELCLEIYHPITGTPMDEAFTRYMYYERARQGNKSSTTEALRKFYEKDYSENKTKGSYSLLKEDKTFENIIDLTNFWKSMSIQDKERFSERVLKRLFVLNYAPNGMWTYITSVFYLANRDADGMLDDEKFYDFLNKITAFIWGYSFTNPGVNALRTPIYAEMLKIVNGGSVDFSEYKFDVNQLSNAINNYDFVNRSPITKSMLTWWAFNDEKQTLPALRQYFQIEHIYAKKRFEIEKGLTNPSNLESLGNKVLLENEINIRAADYKFTDKIRYYKGFKNVRGQSVGDTVIKELHDMADTKNDFDENEIVQRNALIIQKFIGYLRENGLIK